MSATAAQIRGFGEWWQSQRITAYGDDRFPVHRAVPAVDERGKQPYVDTSTELTQR